MTKRKLTLVISLLAIAIMIGGSAIHLYSKHKQEELKRNREYEVSLVKALKNSYEGIEEIELTDPEYTSPPGAWHCEIKLIFSDGEVIKFGASYDKRYEEISQGGIHRTLTNKQQQYLKDHKGTTTNKVKVSYSDKEKENNNVPSIF